MKWTTTPPTKPGWYCFRWANDRTGQWAVFFIWEAQDIGNLWMEDPRDRSKTCPVDYISEALWCLVPEPEPRDG